MAVYIIGDVQGCFDELIELLKLINYRKDKDELWFTGDLVNRGPKSLAVLQFITELPNVITVLGNHDLSLLALACGAINLSDHTLQEVLSSLDKESLLDWLRKRPLLHYDNDNDLVLVHAGIPPQWNLAQAMEYAHETEAILQSELFPELLKNLFGNTPDYWEDTLVGWERQRYIINALTRMRFCNVDGRIDFHYKGPLGSQSPELLPWFKLAWRKTKNTDIAFGHWAALNGQSDEPKIFPLDTGCVWGKKLTAMRLSDKRIFQVSCQKLD